MDIKPCHIEIINKITEKTKEGLIHWERWNCYDYSRLAFISKEEIAGNNIILESCPYKDFNQICFDIETSGIIKSAYNVSIGEFGYQDLRELYMKAREQGLKIQEALESMMEDLSNRKSLQIDEPSNTRISDGTMPTNDDGENRKNKYCPFFYRWIKKFIKSK